MNYYDCTQYDSPSCPKGQQMDKKINEDELNVVMVGCWGVYCWDGNVDIESYEEPNPKKGKVNGIISKVTEKYGQRSVISGIEHYARKKIQKDKKVSAIFLAGDNVYSFNVPKQTLLDMITSGVYPTKKQYKSDVKISGQRIEMQLSDGFTTCLKNIPVDDFFLTIGNHDVQNCHDLNAQLNYKYQDENYKLVGLYYNVVYRLNEFTVNFILIDTNMFSEEFTCDQKTPYTDEQKRTQKQWVIDTLKRDNCDFNIIIGHVPYKAHNHKKGKDPILNEDLDDLFQRIEKERCPKVQVYMCADEHNQQFLYEPETRLSLVVAGSGGTALDKDIFPDKYKNIGIYQEAFFGFVSFEFKKSDLILKYFRSEVETDQKDVLCYRATLSKEGVLLKSEIIEK
jgi:hypothetical protein